MYYLNDFIVIVNSSHLEILYEILKLILSGKQRTFTWNIGEFYRRSHLRCSIEISAWVCNFVRKEALAHMFSCEFCEAFINIFSTEHLRTTAFDSTKILVEIQEKMLEASYKQFKIETFVLTFWLAFSLILKRRIFPKHLWMVAYEWALLFTWLTLFL